MVVAVPRRLSAGVPPLSLLAIALALPLAMPSGEPVALAAEPQATEAAPRLALDSLLARFRASPGLWARYHEEKRIALLARPLVSEGTVHYAPPHRVARHTRVPSPSSVVLDGTVLRFGDGTSEQQIDVRTAPIARVFVESFLGVLAGDRAQLERTFVVDFHAGDATHASESWELSLVPRAADLLGVLREVRFSGDGVVVSQMRIHEANGDEGVTTFSDVDAAHVYTPAEQARVFRVSGAGIN